MEPTESSSPSAAALFSLQVAIDELALRPPAIAGLSPPASRNFVLGFQLLQFDIVLFDATTLSERDGLVELSDQHAAADGQSCLLESDAQQLAQAIRDDASAALVLLVLQREEQRARLVAFACVPLELPHVAFMGNGKVPRVSEWVHIEATWPLLDQAHATLGSVHGSATLACLGRALAPHLTERVGQSMQLMRTNRSMALPAATSRSSSATSDESRDNDQRTEEPDTPSSIVAVALIDQTTDVAKISRTTSPVRRPQATQKREKLRDVSVQCSDPDDDDARQPTSILIRGGVVSPRGVVRDSPRGKIVDELDHLRIGVTGSPRRSRDRIRVTHITRGSVQRFPRHLRQDAPFYLEAELPPPLFFHRPKHPTRTTTG